MDIACAWMHQRIYCVHVSLHIQLNKAIPFTADVIIIKGDISASQILLTHSLWLICCYIMCSFGQAIWSKMRSNWTDNTHKAQQAMLYWLPCQFLWKPESSLVIFLCSPFLCMCSKKTFHLEHVYNHCIKVIQQVIEEQSVAIVFAFPGKNSLAEIAGVGYGCIGLGSDCRFHSGSI